ncbi:MAG TPA: aldolase/citrate lyase family protein [Solirubrobacteraceae bacterium]|nr:aldolase/citrate lyase family protein [Solirubrobacteraceae bacterium]
MDDRHFAQRLRERERIVGYWVMSDNPAAAERIAAAGYDYVCFDLQHGLLDYTGALRGVMAAELGGAVGVVRVPANEPAWIGRALDAGARAVIVPLVDSPRDAAAAARACRYPPAGTRSYGPARSGLTVGTDLRGADERVACIVMIETREGLSNVQQICTTPGIDAVYVGPSDLSIAIGGANPQVGWEMPEFDEALAAIRDAANSAGIACGLHVDDGCAGARGLADGFDFISISSDLGHISALAAKHLRETQS